ncbi:energy transducer TonB [Verrucomicrobiota bacterium]
MKTGIINNIWYSVTLHGAVLALCFAVPAQKLTPLFQAGNSALTLTSLSVSLPEGNQAKDIAVQQKDPDDKAPAVIENNEENSSGDFPDIPAEKTAPAPQQKLHNAGTPIDADNEIKGINSQLAGKSDVMPYYPLGSRIRGEEGVVKVEACVGTDGYVLDCNVIKSSGFPALDKAAMTAIKRAHFVVAGTITPARNNKTVLTFRFDLVD